MLGPPCQPKPVHRALDSLAERGRRDGRPCGPIGRQRQRVDVLGTERAENIRKGRFKIASDERLLRRGPLLGYLPSRAAGDLAAAKAALAQGATLVGGDGQEPEERRAGRIVLPRPRED